MINKVTIEGSSRTSSKVLVSNASSDLYSVPNQEFYLIFTDGTIIKTLNLYKHFGVYEKENHNISDNWQIKIENKGKRLVSSSFESNYKLILYFETICVKFICAFNTFEIDNKSEGSLGSKLLQLFKISDVKIIEKAFKVMDNLHKDTHIYDANVDESDMFYSILKTLKQ